jgi:hypothetical protein
LIGVKVNVETGEHSPMTKTFRLVGFILICAFIFPLAVMAGSDTVAGVTMVTPNDYGSCTATSDTISVTGLTGSGLRLAGKAIVNIILADGNKQVYETVPFDSTVDFNVVVHYPPFSDVPPNEFGVREIHVDIQSALTDAAGTLVGSLGPGLDWDVFCSELPPPPPPPPPPPGNQGCTPGYWKNHLESWAAAGYAPGADFDSTFGVNLFDPNITLETAVNLGGGGANRLARHGVAALLSAAHPGVGYPLSVAEVIAAVQAGNADLLEQSNELGCPL